MEDVGLFFGKNKGRACFFCCPRSQNDVYYNRVSECVTGRKNYGSHGKEMSAVSCAGQLRACKETQKRDKV